MLLNKLDLGDQTSYLKNHEMRRTVKQPQDPETYVAPLPLKYWNYLCFSKFFLEYTGNILKHAPLNYKLCNM